MLHFFGGMEMFELSVGFACITNTGLTGSRQHHILADTDANLVAYSSGGLLQAGGNIHTSY